MTIEYQDRTFDSLIAFCREYNLKYPTVQRQMQKGWTVEEILNAKSSHPNSTVTRNDKPCHYAGVNYPTITLASESLGLPVYAIVEHTKKYRCPMEQAIEFVMEKNPQYQESLQPCCILGKKYGSRAEACLAYRIKYQTVKDKMHREDISFEEALIRIDWKGKRIASYSAILPDLLSGLEETSELDAFSELICGFLRNMHYTPKQYTCEDRIVLQIEEKLNIRMPPHNIYILVHKDSSLSGIMEIFADDLMIPQSLSDDLLDSINEINNKLTGIQIIWNQNRVQALSVSSVSTAQNQMVFQKILNCFISNASEAIKNLNPVDNPPIQTDTTCYVDGYLFPSVLQACNALNVRYVSAMSRVQRLKISPEEAIGNGKRSPLRAVHLDSHREETASSDQLFDLLKKYGYEPQKEGNWFCIQEALDETSGPEKIYLTILANRRSTFMIVECCIPNLLEVKDDSRNKILRNLSLQNSKFHGATAVLSEQKIQTHYAQFINKAGSRAILQLALNRFIGTSGIMRKNLEKLL